MQEEKAGGQGAVLAVVVLGTLMVALDATVVVLALPTIGEELGATLSSAVWVLMAYLLVTAVLATQLGRIGDIMGRKRIYNAGFALFTLGSALCGLSLSMGQLIGSRVLQALGGAMMLANSGAVIADNVPRSSIGRAFGYTALGWNAGATMGVVLGGLITSLLGWRYIFLLNVPIGIAAVVLGQRRIRPSPRVDSRLDLPGLALFSSMLVLASLGATSLAAYGLSPSSAALLLASGILVGPFSLVELRARSPMIDLSAFRQRVLSYALLSAFLQSTGYLSITFIVTMYLQGIRGLDPFHASLLLLPGYLISSLLAPLAGRWSDRLGSRLLASLGMAIMAASVAAYMGLGTSSPLYMVVIASAISGLGVALFYPANNSAIMANAPPAYYGAISGLARTLANVGTLASYMLTLSVSSLAVPREVALQVFLGTTNLLGGLSSQFLMGLHAALAASALVLLAGMVLSSLRGREVRGA